MKKHRGNAAADEIAWFVVQIKVGTLRNPTPSRDAAKSMSHLIRLPRP